MSTFRPGDTAITTNLPPQLIEANDREVKLASKTFVSGEPAWNLCEPVKFVMVGNGRRGERRFWIGEPVCFDRIQEKYLRPAQRKSDESRHLADQLQKA
jgi:hypothetical protein